MRIKIKSEGGALLRIVDFPLKERITATEFPEGILLGNCFSKNLLKSLGKDKTIFEVFPQFQVGYTMP